MKLRCMVVDDEPLARRVLERYIDMLPALELVKECRHAVEAAAFLHEEAVDLIFLDIKMPQMSGMEFLQTLTDPPEVVITTAYSEYALEGYEYSVADYLLKPIEFPRFLKAVNKVMKRKGIGGAAVEKLESGGVDGKKVRTAVDFIFLKADGVNHRVVFDDILYIEGCGNYIKVHMRERRLLVLERMSGILKRLPEELFLRIHKSYIVPISKVEAVKEGKIKIGENVLPIGNSYNQKVREILLSQSTS